MTWDFGSVLALLTLVGVPVYFGWLWLCVHGAMDEPDLVPDTFPEGWVAERLYDREKDAA